MDAILIKANGEVSFVTPRNGTDFQLDELYEILKCELIEIVRAPKNKECIFVVDEEGKLTRKKFNAVATKMYHFEDDYIVGDVLYCRNEMIK